MTLAEKLQKLMERKRQVDVAAEAGIGRGVLNKYMHGSTSPRADIVFRIARTLRVPLDWLLDDTAGWPPPAAHRRAESLSTAELMDELGRRYCREASGMGFFFEIINKINWRQVASVLAETPFESGFPKGLSKEVGTLLSFNHKMQEAFYFDVSAHVHSGTFTETTGESGHATMLLTDIRKQLAVLREDQPEYNVAENWVNCWKRVQESPDLLDFYETARKRMRPALEEIDKERRLKDNPRKKK